MSVVRLPRKALLLSYFQSTAKYDAPPDYINSALTDNSGIPAGGLARRNESSQESWHVSIIQTHFTSFASRASTQTLLAFSLLPVSRHRHSEGPLYLVYETNLLTPNLIALAHLIW
jgi:hypothetical protein